MVLTFITFIPIPYHQHSSLQLSLWYLIVGKLSNGISNRRMRSRRSMIRCMVEVLKEPVIREMK